MSLRLTLREVKRKGKRGQDLGEADPGDTLTRPVTKITFGRMNQRGYILHRWILDFVERNL
jgi:hypothetical protein